MGDFSVAARFSFFIIWTHEAEEEKSQREDVHMAKKAVTISDVDDSTKIK